jgi:peptidyl-dipeptidase A
LSECSIFGNEAAGKKFGAMLEKGASQPWQDTMYELTGTRQMDASALIEYFEPLQGWLKQQNQGQTCGW